jgi:undecaprenyl diphosphate synthase
LNPKFWQRRKSAKVNESLSIDPANIPQHVAIIMDGNGRWAQKRGLPRTFGHKAGAEVLRAILTEASDLGIRYLTAYAFSTENWRRPHDEVDFLMNLFSSYLDNEVEYLAENQVRLRFIGSTVRLSPDFQRRIVEAEARTALGTGITLNLAVDYGGRAEIVQAASRLAQEVLDGKLSVDEIDENTFASVLYTHDQPDPDLLIRPGGDMRISNFLLWQLAYAELWVTEVLWPDFTVHHFHRAIHDFQKRDRRFGGLMPQK